MKVSDEDAADFADALMLETGYAENPYLVVRHFDKEDRAVNAYSHIHIVASRIGDDGALVAELKIAERAIEASKKIDQKFGFESAVYESQQARTGTRNIKKDEYQMMARVGRLSVLEEFKDCAEKSLGARRNLQEFVEDLQQEGFEVLPNISGTTEQMRGFSFAKSGVIFTGKKAGEEFKWANLAVSLNYEPEQDGAFLLSLKTAFQAKKELEKTPCRQAQTEPVSQPHSEKEARSEERSAGKVKLPTIALEQPKINKEGVGVKENETPPERSANGRSTPIESPIGRGNTIAESPDISRLVSEKSPSQAKISAVADAARNRSGEGVAEAENSARQSAQSGRGGTGDQTTRSRPPVAADDAGNGAANSFREHQNANYNAADEGSAERDRQNARRTERTAVENEDSPSFNSRSRARTEKGEEPSSRVSAVGRGDAGGDRERIEFSEFIAAQPPDQRQLPTVPGDRVSQSAGKGERQTDQLDSETIKRGAFGGNLERKIKKEVETKDVHGVKGDRSAVHPVARVDSYERNLQFSDDGGFDTRAGARETINESLDDARRNSGAGKSTDSGGFRRNNTNSQESDSASRQLIQVKPKRPASSNQCRRTAIRRAAERAAQVINVKYFSSQVDQRIVAEWTAVIEAGDAERFFDEIINLKTYDDEQRIFEHFERQSSVIAERLKFDKPQAALQSNPHKLALTLTKMEVASYEKETGKLTGEKAIEILVKKNELHSAVAAAIPSPIADGHLLAEGDDFSRIPSFSSELEMRTFQALINPSAVQFDSKLIERAQNEATRNDRAARETATLVQIAYGGQAAGFTEDSKNELIERIYRAPQSAPVIYEAVNRYDWRKTVEVFAPVIQSITKRNQVAIETPESDQVRNRMLADFATQQLIGAYENRNSLLPPQSVTNEINERFMRTSETMMTESQQNRITAAASETLLAPRFATALEASVYTVISYTNDEKSLKATQIVAQIRDEQLKLERRERREVKQRRALSM